MAKCPYMKEKEPAGPVQRWSEATVGKPISEWPPMPKEITFIKYDNGIILTTADGLTGWLEESGWRYENAK